MQLGRQAASFCRHDATGLLGPLLNSQPIRRSQAVTKTLAQQIQPSCRPRSDVRLMPMTMAASSKAVTSTSTGSTLLKEAETARIVVATTPGCQFCRRAKAALSEAGHQYTELNVGLDSGLRAAVREAAGKTSVPQIFIAGRSIGGSDDLATLLSTPAESGSGSRFDQVLREAGQQRGLPQSVLQAVSTSESASSPGQEAKNTPQLALPLDRLQGLAARMAAPTQAGGIARRQQAAEGGRTWQAFSGAELLTWLADQAPASSQTPPQAVAASLLGGRLITPTGPSATSALPHSSSSSSQAPGSEAGQQQPQLPAVNPGDWYSLASEAPPVPVGQPLNSRLWWAGPARPAAQVAAELRTLILSLYDSHLSADGRSVSYADMRKDPRFEEYVAASAELQAVDLKPLSREELMALFINLYNAAIIHALVVLGAPKNAVERTKFFTSDVKYRVGGYDYTADDMENGVLRGNRAAASNLWVLLGLHRFAGGQFKPSDPRAAKVVTPMDPRIHFALVCGARSCPPIKLYTPENLEEGLTAAGQVFCAGEVEVDRTSSTVRLSKIFKWYSVDFGKDDREKLTWILPFLQGQAHDDLKSLLQGQGKIRVDYKEYDWSLNG